MAIREPVAERVVVEVSPLNRVEGDLDIRAAIEGGRVTDARASAVMFRGFEIILRGKAPMDPLVITPRICGICGQAHLRTAVHALESAWDAEVPPNGTLVRNICLGVENAQSHATWFYALFAIDLTREKYSGHPAYPELVRRFAPFTGTSYRGAVQARKRFLEIIAIFGGQWPHSSYMVPGGVTCSPYLNDITKSVAILDEFQRFVEQTVLGCPVERWLENRSAEDVRRWLEEDPSHAESDLGLFLRVGPELGLADIGRGPGRFLAAGVYDEPDSRFPGRPEERRTWLKAGFYDGERLQPFDHLKIAEHIAHSWFEGYEGGRHPWEGVTRPAYAVGAAVGEVAAGQASGGGSPVAGGDLPTDGKYSWAKAPRYDGRVVEVGPLARMVCDQDPLITDLLARMGPSVFLRGVARLHEMVRTLPKIREWLGALDLRQPFYQRPVPKDDARGVGLNEAARGALIHWTVLKGGRIENYQVITPTAWNISPRDSLGQPGAIEQALLGTPVADARDPLELGHVVRSYDACLVCTVHAVSGGEVTRYRLEV